MLTQSKLHMNPALFVSIIFYMMAILLRIVTDEAPGMVFFFFGVGFIASFLSWCQVTEDYEMQKKGQ